jgi:DNA processing protein
MKYLCALHTIPNLGSGALRQLYGHFQSGEAIWNAPQGQLQQAGIGPALIKNILIHRTSIDPQEIWGKIEAEGISVVAFFDNDYPVLLKEIPNPPFLIYYRGNLDCLKLPSLAVVGSRKFTYYGKQAAEKFSYDLAKAGLCIVSGLALGIDAIAHRGALDANGKTVAILGGGVEDGCIQPRTNYQLAQEILSRGGLLMSEFPLGTPPAVGTFPCRDLTMAALTLGTLVVEAAEGSGSLITPSHAVEFNREVFAIPGPIFSPQSVGTNALIKKGAKMATCVKDILEELRLQQTGQMAQPRAKIDLTSEEESVSHVLSPEPTHVDRIIKLTKLETSCVISALSMLEIKGVAKNIGGQNYIKL